MAIKNYKQYDPQWANKTIGGSSMTMREGGCGVCAMANLLDIRPDTLAAYMDSKGFIHPSQGTYHEAIALTMAHYGAKATMITPGYTNGQLTSPYFDQFEKHVQSGYCAILLMGGQLTNAGGACRTSYWSQRGHYITVCGYKDGKYLVHDPAYDARDGYHLMYGSADDCFNGNIKKIFTTNVKWSQGAASYSFSLPQLQLGSRGVAVLLCQEILKARDFRGYDKKELDLDRSYGGNTRAAVLAFQESEPALVNDGICGINTWKTLLGMSKFEVHEIRIGSVGVEVLLLQEILKARGFYKGELDRSYGQQTYNAVLAYQRTESALANDGVCGLHTWRALIAL